MTAQLQTIIDTAWDNRAQLSPASAPKEVSEAVEHVISELNKGRLRVDTRERGAPPMTTGKTTEPVADADLYDYQDEGAEALIARIIAANRS